MIFFHTALWYLENTIYYLIQTLPCVGVAAILFFFIQPARQRRLAGRGLESPRPRETALLLFVMFCAGLASLTLFPGGFWRWQRWILVLRGQAPLFPPVDVRAQIAAIQRVPFLEIRRAFRGPWVMFIMVANILIFCPIGFFSGLLWRRARWWKALAGGLASSAGIEFIQLFVGRRTDIDDVILNTAGALAGYWLYCLFRGCFPGWAETFHCREKGDRTPWRS